MSLSGGLAAAVFLGSQSEGGLREGAEVEEEGADWRRRRKRRASSERRGGGGGASEAAASGAAVEAAAASAADAGSDAGASPSAMALGEGKRGSGEEEKGERPRLRQK